MTVQTTGFVIHRYPFRDADLILKVFTPTHGVLSLLAKGAKRSKTLAYFEPFQRIDFTCFGRGDLKTLRMLEPTFPGEIRRWVGDRLYSAFYVNELLLNLLPPAFSASLQGAELFAVYESTLQGLSLAEVPLEPVLRTFEIALFRTLGVWPDLTQDQNGKPIEPSRGYRLMAESLPQPVPDGLADFTGEELLGIAGSCWASPSVLRAAKRLLRHWVSVYSDGKPFKSRECFTTKESAE